VRAKVCIDRRHLVALRAILLKALFKQANARTLTEVRRAEINRITSSPFSSANKTAALEKIRN
jgi:hypothetical protein